jgi:hypothetical protein
VGSQKNRERAVVLTDIVVVPAVLPETTTLEGLAVQLAAVGAPAQVMAKVAAKLLTEVNAKA